MKVIKGDDDLEAHLHRRMKAECDLCGEALRGPMPKPFWLAPTRRGSAERAEPENPVRVYACKEHREQLTDIVKRAYVRERNRMLSGQEMFPEMRRPRPVD